MEKFKNILIAFLIYVISIILITYNFGDKPTVYVIAMIIATLSYLLYVLNEK